MNCNKLRSAIAAVLLCQVCFAMPERFVLPLRNSEGHWGFYYEDGTLAVPFSFKWVSPFAENGLFQALCVDGSETYVDAHGKVSSKKEELASYRPPVVERVESNGVYVLIHRDGCVMPFPDVLRMHVYDDGCATCVTKDGRGGFSKSPLVEDSWMYFAAFTRSVVSYDRYDKIISYTTVATNRFGGFAWRYLNLDGSVAETLESAVSQYDFSFYSKRGRIPVLKEINGVRRCGVLSHSGDVLVSCRYDSLDVTSDYICCWENDKKKMTSDVTFFDESGLQVLKLQVDLDDECAELHRPIQYWYPFVINGAFCWINVRDKKKLQCENDRVFLSRIQ